VRAISEGRQLFRNLKLSFAYLLMMHMPLVAIAALVPFAGFPLLYLPMHVVWLELIIHPTALLVFQELPTSDKLDPVQRPVGVQHSTLKRAIAAAGCVTLRSVPAVHGSFASVRVNSWAPIDIEKPASTVASNGKVVPVTSLRFGLSGGPCGIGIAVPPLT